MGYLIDWLLNDKCLCIPMDKTVRLRWYIRLHPCPKCFFSECNCCHKQFLMLALVICLIFDLRFDQNTSNLEVIVRLRFNEGLNPQFSFVFWWFFAISIIALIFVMLSISSLSHDYWNLILNRLSLITKQLSSQINGSQI